MRLRLYLAVIVRPTTAWQLVENVSQKPTKFYTWDLTVVLVNIEVVEIMGVANYRKIAVWNALLAPGAPCWILIAAQEPSRSPIGERCPSSPDRGPAALRMPAAAEGN